MTQVTQAVNEALHTPETGWIEQDTIQVISCGGTGLNIGALLDDRFQTTMFDLSNSNFSEDHFDNDDSKTLHIIAGKDGTGKMRELAYAAFESRVKAYVSDIPMSSRPTIVVSSLGGGTGSTFAPMIVAELLARGSVVIVIGVCNTTDTVQLRNTIKTIYSYRNVVDMTNTPVPMVFFNKPSEKEVNLEVVDTLNFIDQITDKNVVSSFDTEDMKVSLRYNIPFPEMAPELTFLTRVNNEPLPNKAFDPDRHVVISSTLVVKDQDTPFEGIVPMYSSKAIVRNRAVDLDNTRLDNIIGIFDDVVGMLELDLEEREAKLKRVAPTVTKKKSSSKGGFMVL